MTTQTWQYKRWAVTAAPDDGARRRDECAFEPMPGPGSVLDDAAIRDGVLRLPPHTEQRWDIVWSIDPTPRASTCPRE